MQVVMRSDILRKSLILDSCSGPNVSSDETVLMFNFVWAGWLFRREYLYSIVYSITTITVLPIVSTVYTETRFAHTGSGFLHRMRMCKSFISNAWGFIDFTVFRGLEAMIFRLCLTHTEHRNLVLFSFQYTDWSSEAITILKIDLNFYQVYLLEIDFYAFLILSLNPRKNVYYKRSR